jgi:hypothetical protein
VRYTVPIPHGVPHPVADIPLELHMMIVETDSDPALWFHMPLGVTKSEFAQWLDLQLDASALLHRR